MFKITLFGILSQLINKQEIEIEICSDTEQLLNLIFENYPLLKNQNFSIAVNYQIVNEKKIINPQDKIALLPPFSGG